MHIFCKTYCYISEQFFKLNGVSVIPISQFFFKIHPMVRKLEGHTHTHTHTQHGYLINLLSFLMEGN